VSQYLDFSDHFFGVVNVSENIINKLDGNYFAGVQVLSFDDLSKAAFSEIFHELVVACNVVPFSSENKVAFLEVRCFLFHYAFTNLRLV